MTEVVNDRVTLMIGFGALCLFTLINISHLKYGQPTLDLVAYSTLAYCIVYTLVVIGYNR